MLWYWQVLWIIAHARYVEHYWWQIEQQERWYQLLETVLRKNER